ncbi:MAG: cytochrome c biogenesis protein ResB, partial [Parachlamydiaceae bacterium]|nr:cytochrome c biogenesis protein ResB [Parachlamydiaceae bacterium]
LSLGYDRFAQGLKWPILNGAYLLRFQPLFEEIPYNIRLRQAHQINYANSQQALSYESDIIVTDLRSGESFEKTISMNQVHETWDGYRFYLSNITSGDESSVKRIQIVVNHDPAKYWLTYPGAIILSLGIILLFWMKPYRKQKEKK